jgi:glycosyltransferase involved in cell wall biosynthesis
VELTGKTKVLIIRSNHCNPDPRVQKIRDFLESSHYSVWTLGWNRTGDAQELTEVGTKVKKLELVGIRAPYGNGLKNLFAQFRYQFALMHRLFRDYRDIDVIHACNLDTGLVAFIFCKLTKKKFVYDCFDFYSDSFPVPSFLKPIVKSLELRLISAAEVVFIASENRAEQIEGARPKVLGVLPNVPPVIHKVLDSAINPRLTLGYVGSLTSQRFLLEVIEIVKSSENLALRIAGFGEYEVDIERESQNCNRIEFYGRVDYSKGLEIAASCDVLFAMYDPRVPNHKYSAPNKYYEAAMLGKPLIVCEGTSTDKLLIAHGTGYVANYSIEDFSKVLTNILDEPESLVYKGSLAKSLFEREYTLDKVREKFLKDYEKIWS